MALSNVSSGSEMQYTQVQQLIDLLTGIMTDQAATLVNTLSIGGSQGVAAHALSIVGVGSQSGDFLRITPSGAGSPTWRIQSDSTLTIPNSVIPAAALAITLTSGTYTPTFTAVANVAAATPNPCHWHRIGNQVFVSGWGAIDPTSAATLTTFRISLPVASNFAISTDAGGVLVGAGEDVTAGGLINAVVATDDVIASFFPAGAANQGVGFSFAYSVI